MENYTTKYTREEAIQFVDNYLANLTPKLAHDFFEQCNFDIAILYSKITFFGISGWYYDNNCTEFCNRAIAREIVRQTIEYLKN